MAVLPLVAALLTATSAPAPDLHTTGINLYIGDLGAVAGYVPSLEGLSVAEAERERIRGHLRYAHDLLAAADTSAWPAERRASDDERLMHVIPRAGFGLLFARRLGTVSFDTAVALDPTDHGDLRTRFSAGVTGRLARTDGTGWSLQPALTLATVRSPEGWGATIAIDLAASAKLRRRYGD